MGRFLIGYLLSVVIAVTLGLILGWFPKAFSYVNPVVQVIRPIAPVAWLPFIVLLVGIGDVPAIAIIFIAGFFPILLATVTAVKNMDPIYLKVAKNFDLTQRETLTKIVFPATFPQIIASLAPGAQHLLDLPGVWRNGRVPVRSRLSGDGRKKLHPGRRAAGNDDYHRSNRSAAGYAHWPDRKSRLQKVGLRIVKYVNEDG